jgi:hypothetical protein
VFLLMPNNQKSREKKVPEVGSWNGNLQQSQILNKLHDFLICFGDTGVEPRTFA